MTNAEEMNEKVEAIREVYYQRWIDWVKQQSVPSTDIKYSDLGEEGRQAFFGMSTLAEGYELQSLEMERLQKHIERLEQERSYLDRLIGDAVYLAVQAIGNKLTHADKNVQICKAIYPLIQQIPVSLGSRSHFSIEYHDAEF